MRFPGPTLSTQKGIGYWLIVYCVSLFLIFLPIYLSISDQAISFSSAVLTSAAIGMPLGWLARVATVRMRQLEKLYMSQPVKLAYKPISTFRLNCNALLLSALFYIAAWMSR